ncbi:MAG: hypothetical protein ACI856_000695 [Kiritimatiellia bacterium]|jgi:hypothetical protein|tara:strand:- start:2917 stop:3090 length:174 start_codon:yes stop_codon:yes gene_type:complete
MPVDPFICRVMLCAEDCQRQFSHEFFGGIGCTAKSDLQIAIEPRRMPCPMAIMPMSA